MEDLVNEFDTLDECTNLLREVQSKLNQLKSKDEEWNKDVCSGIDDLCSILTV